MATVFVGNLSPEVTEGDLRQVFETFGRITSIKLIVRRRFALVELAPEAAAAAVEGLRGTELKGRTVDVALDRSPGARPRQRRSHGGFRRRR